MEYRLYYIERLILYTSWSNDPLSRETLESIDKGNEGLTERFTV